MDESKDYLMIESFKNILEDKWKKSVEIWTKDIGLTYHTYAMESVENDDNFLRPKMCKL